MAITDQDIRLMASEILTDDADGGGRMTGHEVVDGVSNNLFPDVSELDRTIGRVALRKAYTAVLSANTDTYYGSNVIIDRVPSDPNVSVTLFSTKSWDDLRVAAVSRMESYLARGPKYQGYLYGQHIAGQKAILLLQRTDRPLPVVGTTLVIVQGGEQQFVKVTNVTAAEYSFSAASCNEFTRVVVTCEISDRLLFDVEGGIPHCNDDIGEDAGSSEVYTAIVADAAKYAGMVALEEAATTGDFVIKAKSIYTQLVPSAQVETAITDTRPNGDSAIYIPSGGAISRVIVTSNEQGSLYLGTGVVPGSISATSTVYSGQDITDEAGVLYANGTQVGTVDYSNGILVSTTAFDWATINVTYTPAASPTRNTQSAAWDITAETRSGTVVFILDPVPAPGSLSISFMAQGKWYVLSDDSSGALRGADSSYGSGVVNLITGSAVVTLGALPDVGSSIIATWGTDVIDIDRSGGSIKAKQLLTVTTPLDGGNETSLARNGVSLSWAAGAKTATDDGAGNLTGDATGRVNYVDKTIEFIPHTLPAGGDTITVENGYGPMSNAFTPSGNTLTLDTPPVPGTVKITIPISATNHDGQVAAGSVTFIDDTAGNLVVESISHSSDIVGTSAGTVDYGTGVCTFSNFLAATITYEYDSTCTTVSVGT